ncbi:hypothetical protein QWJ34_00690 [Saccharibacillus sp. CPCC 101409]|uniref:hypothetical protein n=1 Tax=Saccharibacillus sp. CPCC 101409 TaxID=3058041 RepID=UPI00267389E5|nr:hypothetical protein [Saccharibacillus sp. CPCC 101409]MDO3408275.1 hypothetical protein [Saccharibacillus sp. CPCC 101409]
MELSNEYVRQRQKIEPEQEEANLEGIQFFMNNVMNISEATRKNKLAEILENFAVKQDKKVYVIQNSKKKEAAGVVSSLKHYLDREKMLRELQDEVLRLSEEVLLLKVQVREDQPTLTLAEAMQKMNFDEAELKDIFDNADEVKID